MLVRRSQSDDVDACVAVVQALPEYFTPSTHDEIRRDIPVHPSWVAVDNDAIVGFVLAPRRYTAGAEITFAAVVPTRQGNGIGTALVERCLADLSSEGVAMVEVKTLDGTSGYEPYGATRAFWERRGFVQVDCIDPLPGWEPGNPSAIYTRSIR